MVRRYYSSVASVAALTTGVNSSATVLPLSSVTGFPPSTPFTLVLDRGTGSEEIVTVLSVAGLAATVVRGQDGSAAQSHATGAEVRHMMTGRDLGEPQAHIEATAGVHGLAGGAAVVGTTTTQTLSGKSISGVDNTVTGLPTTALVDGAVTTVKLAADSVTAPKIATGAVGTTELADRSVTAAKIELTSSVTSGTTVFAGWVVESEVYLIRGGSVHVRLDVRRSGTDLSVPANGNIGNVTMVTAPASVRGTSGTYWPLHGFDGRAVGAIIVPSTGVVSLTSVLPGSAVATDDIISIGGSYPL